jgi:toxin ParE1/3/4
MLRRTVRLTPKARADLAQIFRWIADRAGPHVARRYVKRVEQKCYSLSLVAERGTRHDKLRLGLRIIGFERRISIAFIVRPDEVTILRVFYGGQNWEAAFA